MPLRHLGSDSPAPGLPCLVVEGYAAGGADRPTVIPCITGGGGGLVVLLPVI